MIDTLAQEAISHALSARWPKAIEVNSEILKKDPNNLDALNRLAKAYSEVGKVTLARKTASEVLKIDPSNPIATKALEKWKIIKSGKTSSGGGETEVENFIEEPGKTKMIYLMHLGDQKILAKIDCGDRVNLDIHSHRVEVTSKDGKYIGRLPDDLSARLKKLIAMGNKYKAHVKSADKKEVKVFIREVSKSAKIKDVQSFSTEKIDYISFTPPELVHDKQEITSDVSEEE